MRRKLEENQRESVQKKNLKGKKENNTNQRKNVNEAEEQKINLDSVKSIKTKEKTWARSGKNKGIKERGIA